MQIIMAFIFSALVFASVIIACLWLAFYVFPETKPGRAFYRIFIDGDYDGQ